MGKVKILGPEIVSKIAAGEVVDRPASLVKELIENALDAHTSKIDITLTQAGKTFIHIKDSGTGIEPDDLEKIFRRHATSKLTTLNDLYTIQSLGFRGEALYSIASVSDIIVRSKTQGEDAGRQIHVRGGTHLTLHPINMPQGTEVEVRELFFNTPARKKFLKSDLTELHHILNTVTPYTLVYPLCRFTLTHYNKTLLELSSQPSMIERASGVLGLNSQHIIEAQHNIPRQNISLKFLLGDINIRRAKKDMQFIFVNKRPVQHRGIRYCLNHAYRSILPHDVHPFFMLHIELPPQDVDVNIHPTKREVKIKDEYNLISLLRSLCEKILVEQGMPRQMDASPFNHSLGRHQDNVSVSTPSSHISPEVSQTKTQATVHQYRLVQEEQLPQLEERGIDFSKKYAIPHTEHATYKEKLSQARFVGTFIKKYLLFEYHTSLLIVDQHAAQERITFEKLKKQVNQGHLATQHLLSPLTLKVSAQEMLNWESGKDKLSELGFSTTLWDKETIAIHTYPQLIKDPHTSVRNILGEESVSRCDLETLARRACRQSLMTGYEMIKEQADYLRNELLKCTSPFTCPHGRPIIIELQEKMLDKYFLRKK